MVRAHCLTLCVQGSTREVANHGEQLFLKPAVKTVDHHWTPRTVTASWWLGAVAGFAERSETNKKCGTLFAE